MATCIPELLSSYTVQIHRVPKLKRNSIQEQCKVIIKNSKADTKKMWKTINRVFNKDTQFTVLSNVNKDGKVLTKDFYMTEALNHHFVSDETNMTKK